MLETLLTLNETKQFLRRSRRYIGQKNTLQVKKRVFESQQSSKRDDNSTSVPINGTVDRKTT